MSAILERRYQENKKAQMEKANISPGVGAIDFSFLSQPKKPEMNHQDKMFNGMMKDKLGDQKSGFFDELPFVSNFKESMGEAKQNASERFDRVEEEALADGKITGGDVIKGVAKTALPALGDGAKVLGETVIGGIFDTVKAITPDFIEDKIGEGLGKLADTSLGRMGLRALSQGMEAYNDFAESHPNTAEQIGAGFNIAELVPGAKLATTSAKATANTAQGIKNAGDKVAEGSVKVGEGLTKQVTGLSDDSFQELKKGNEFIKDAKEGNISREGLGDTVEDAISNKEKQLRDVGAEFEAVRASGQSIDNPIDEVNEFLGTRGLKFEEGKVSELSNLSSNLTKTDMNQLQEALNLFTSEKSLSADQVLNLRNKLDDLAKFDSATSTKGRDAISGLRGVVDTRAKAGISGLKEADAKFKTKITKLKKLRKDFIDNDGHLKDNAFSKIANASNKGKEKLIQRLEDLEPGIGEKIRALRTVEELGNVNKPGTYVRAGTALAATATGNPLGIAIAIASQPQVASKFISATYGGVRKGKKFKDNVVQGIRMPNFISDNAKRALEPIADNIIKIGDKIDSKVNLSSKDLSDLEKFFNIVGAPGVIDTGLNSSQGTSPKAEDLLR